MSDSKTGLSKSEHKIILKLREQLCISGVKEILNFDDTEVTAKTLCGELTIDGEKLHVNALNIENGELEISGKINGINYFDAYDGDKKTLLSRIFK